MIKEKNELFEHSLSLSSLYKITEKNIILEVLEIQSLALW